MFNLTSIRSLTCLAVTALSGAFATPAMSADIFVTVTGVRSANGYVLACLWLSGWGFPD
jgi:hypothetical protein